MLQSNNISAAQIRDDYERRAAESARRAAEQEETAADPSYNEEPVPEPQPLSPEEKTRKRKRQQAIERIKKSKAFARRKAQRAGESDDDDDDDALADRMINEKKGPPPGQLANCEICDKRFTVTAYSKAGPGGGLLCADCSKNYDNGVKKGPAKKRGLGIERRQYQSNLLDGLNPHGAQSLLEMCIKVSPLNIP